MISVVDCHLHTEFSKDAELNLSWVMAHAAGLGLAGVCPTEHYDPAPTDPRFRDLDLDEMFCRHRHMVEAPQPVALGIGLEVTYRPEKENELRCLLSARTFDLVIGAVHDIDGRYLREWIQAQPQRQSLRERLVPFVTLTADMVRSRLFRVIGHIDYVKRYVPELTGEALVGMFRDEFAEILVELLTQGNILELNLAGLRHQPREPYPSRTLLDLYHDLGGEVVTLGSDAHAALHYQLPLRRGLDFARAAGLRVIDWRSLAPADQPA